MFKTLFLPVFCSIHDMAFCIPPSPPPPGIRNNNRPVEDRKSAITEPFAKTLWGCAENQGPWWLQFSNHRRKNVPKRNSVIVQYVHAVQHHEGQQIFVLKGTLQRELMYVQHHEGQQIFVLKGPVQRELKFGPNLVSFSLSVLRKKKEERRGRKGERNV